MTMRDVILLADGLAVDAQLEAEVARLPAEHPRGSRRNRPHAFGFDLTCRATHRPTVPVARGTPHSRTTTC